ncbi:hypothetical protein M3Y94_00401100 [Aphelenchoides besseyi]|nr:hypothetical protein M3Y94_00401100 [Aphelenchoides besseyi]KAI6218445.1 hypothetical protein M3Y95_01165000 [Aphelenchoides besseyi]
MDLLGIKDNTASRPSLISSMWSLQVQPQQETMIVDVQMGSQQSLPEVLNSSTIMETQYGSPMDQNSKIRPSKSLTELSQFFKDSRLLRIHEAPSFIWKRESQGKCSSSYRNDNSSISRQQKERNICEWLERINCNDDRSVGAGIGRGMAISPTTPGSSNVQMSGATGSTFSKQTPMQH